MQTVTRETTTPPAVSTLPDGDALANEMIAASGAKDVSALLKRQRAGGQSVKAHRESGDAPRVQFAPRGWSFSGGID